MDNNALYKKTGMGAAEETSILDRIENDISTSTIEATTNYITVYM